MPKKYRIELSPSERELLESVCRKQRVSAQKKLRARVFLLSDESREGGALKDLEIAEKTGMAISSIERLRKQCHEQGPIGSLERKRRLTPPREVKVDGKLEAEITALACSGCWRPPIWATARYMCPRAVGARPRTTPLRCAASPTRCTPKRKRSSSFRTISTPMGWICFMPRSSPARRAGWPNASSSTSLPSTGVGQYRRDRDCCTQPQLPQRASLLHRTVQD